MAVCWASTAWACTAGAHIVIRDSVQAVAPGETFVVHGEQYLDVPIQIRVADSIEAAEAPTAQVLATTRGPEFNVEVSFPAGTLPGRHTLWALNELQPGVYTVRNGELASASIRLTAAPEGSPPAADPGPTDTTPTTAIPKNDEIAGPGATPTGGDPQTTPGAAARPGSPRSGATAGPEVTPSAAPGAPADPSTATAGGTGGIGGGGASDPAAGPVEGQLPTPPEASDIWSGLDASRPAASLLEEPSASPGSAPPVGIVLLSLGTLALAGVALARRRQVVLAQQRRS